MDSKENNKRIKYTCFQDQVDEMCAILAERVVMEVPEDGNFDPVMVFTKNYYSGTQHIVGKYGLQVCKFPADLVPDSKMRYIMAAAYMPDGVYKADMYAEKGYKEEIIKTLKDPEFAKKLYGTFGRLVQILKDQ